MKFVEGECDVVVAQVEHLQGFQLAQLGEPACVATRQASQNRTTRTHAEKETDGTADEFVAEVEVDQVVEVLHAAQHLHAVVGQGEKDERGKLGEAGAVQGVVVRTQPLEPGHVR